MNSIILILVAVQALLVAIVARRLGRDCLGKVGFLLIGATFIYHGLTEVAQFVFPNHDPYRDDITLDWVAWWVTLMTAAMALFTITYLYRTKHRNIRRQLPELISQLGGAFLLQWPVLLALGVPSFLFILLRAQNDVAGGYWASGLAFQFTPIILTLSFATMCIKTHGRGFLLIFVGFSVLLIASGSRYEILATALVVISVMARYGIRLPASTLLAIPTILIVSFVAISASRGNYGRFNSGESFMVRIQTIASTIVSPEKISAEEMLDDSVYRFDGNSFGAMILEKQGEGYGSTGIAQVKATVAYLIPSFLYRGKLNLDEYLRNEEGYVVEFYGLPVIDYMSDFWSLLLCYAGPWGLLLCAPIIGWFCASLDNWLGRTAAVIPYLIGLGISRIPVNLESGFLANIFDTLRTLLALAFGVWLLSRRTRRKSKAQDASRVAPPLRLPQHT